MSEGKPNEGFDRSSLIARQYETTALNLRRRWLLYDNCAVEKVDFYDEAVKAMLLAQPDVVVDVGCSDGLNVVQAALKNNLTAELIGVDPFDGPYNIIKQTLPPSHFTFMKGFAEGLIFPDSSIDALLELFTIYHTSPVSRSLGEIQRVVKPGGLAAISTNSRENKPRHRAFERMLTNYFNEEALPAPAHPFSSERAAKVLPKVFEVITVVSQVCEMHVTEEYYELYEWSLLSMCDSLEIYIPGKKWLDAIQRLVKPIIMQEIEDKARSNQAAGIDEPGYFTDQVSRQLFICRNIKTAA
jgi:ubiquinone/menaquinone biosynthesis C-methylase UbiE